MKRKTAMILSLIMVFSLIFGNMSVMAEETNKGHVRVNSVSGAPGETVDVEVMLDKNPGIVALYLAIGYDADVLTLNKGGVKPADTFPVSDYMAGDLNANPVVVSWLLAMAAENDISTGKLVTLSFTISEDAQPGQSYDITVGQYANNAPFDIDYNDVEFEYQTGKVNVTVPAHDHVFDGRTEIIQEATCTKEGKVKVYCSVEGCDAYQEKTVPAAGHKAGKWEIVKEAACTEEGLKVQKCTVCGVKIKEEVINAKGHVWGEWVTEKEPEIGVEGSKNRTCTVCGTVERQMIPAIIHEDKDHVFDGKSTIVKEATCTEDGILRTECSFAGCSAYQDTVIPAKGHTAGEWVVEKEATCTESGLKRKYCTVCHEKIAEEILSAKGHDGGEWEIVDEADCIHEGKKEQYCTVCHEKCGEEVLPAKGHMFGEWTVVKEPTFHEDGLKERICEVCGDKLEASVPKLSESHVHDFSGEEIVVKEATCTENGIVEIACSNSECDEVQKIETPKLGHDFGEWKVIKKATDKENGLKEHECSVCGTVEQEKIPALKVDNEDKTVNENSTVQTGDPSHVGAWLLVMGIALVSGCGVVITRRRCQR